MQQFNASVIISEQLNRLMVNAAQELAQRAVSACAEHYKFDAEEAISLLGLNNVKLERKGAVKDDDGEKAKKVNVPKPKFPLPYNGEFNDSYCYALRQNNGLYTQCLGVRGNAQFCKSCTKLMQKTGSDMPEFGTIQQRQAVDIFEYVDPNGRKPIAYTKLMKKYKLTQEAVLEEAGKLNITINNEHFIAPEEETKRGRRKNEDKMEEKPKGPKGRPKKEKKVMQIEGDDDEDLFAALVQEANNNAQEEDDVSQSSSSSDDVSPSPSPKKNAVSDEETEADAYERLEREALKEKEKAEKAAKKEQERIEREAKKKAEEEEKAAKAAKKEQERIEREAKKKAEEEEKAAKKLSKKEKEVKPAKEEEEDDDEDDEEPDIVKKIEHDGKKYLKSKKTGIIYDYTKYVKDGEQIKVGRWNEKTNKIDFQENDEESEEEYDE
jgi:hypothetical protein